MKKLLAAVLAAAAILTMSGCVSATSGNAMNFYDFAGMNTDFIQLKGPSEGDTIAIIDTDYGEIRVVLYEQYAPNTVANFIDRAESGEYNNKVVYAVLPNSYFMSGGFENSKGQYTGRNANNELIDNECTPDLWPFTGALMSYSEKSGKSDARWMICSSDRDNITQESINELKDSAMGRKDETERNNLLTLFDTFYEVGGVFGASGFTTVFGQTYQGLDVVEKLCAIPAAADGRASEEVYIRTVTISTYHAEEE